MGANSYNHNHNHTTNTIKIDIDRLAAIHQRINCPPKILSKAAGRSTCSIFKVPKSFTDLNGKLYQPQIISIGPFHHGLPRVQMMEEHKYHYLGQLLARTNLTLNTLFVAVAPLVEAIRVCYSETIHLDEQRFLEMMVVDGCFILEFYRKVSKIVPFETDDPLVSMMWIFPSILRDLHRLENQIPFFVLERLFGLTSSGKDLEDEHILANQFLEFFNYTIQRPLDSVAWRHKDRQPKHLLDLLRSSFITPELPLKKKPFKAIPTKSRVILSISKLRSAGIHIRPGKSETFLAVKFKRGTIEMPTFTLDDFMGSLFANCVAYEQCHKGCSTYFTSYATLLDCLVNTAKDVDYLCDKNIIENYYGTEEEIATFINNLGKEVACDIDQCYLGKLFDDVNIYYKNSCHVYWASFKFTYFNTPWSFISAIAALLLLLLTVFQALYSMLQYYQQPQS